MGTILLIIYCLGVIACGIVLYKINKKSKKLNIYDILFGIYLLVLSWFGVFVLFAGALVNFNQLNEDE